MSCESKTLDWANPAEALILGLGASGRASAELLAARGWRVKGADTRTDAALAEDVVSVVFFELYKRKKPFDETGGARFETYLFRIARNRALNAVRGRRRRREKGISGNERDATDLEEELIRKERARAVHRALAALPEEERTALHLRYFEDMSPEQIARVTGGGVKRTYNRLARGRVLMKQILEKEVRDEDGQTDRR